MYLFASLELSGIRRIYSGHGEWSRAAPTCLRRRDCAGSTTFIIAKRWEKRRKG